MKGNKKTGKKPMPKRKSVGWTAKTRPKPHESPLWPHLQLIRTMRLGRHTWAEIAEAIHKAGGPKAAVNTVYQFYKRVAERAKKGKGLPLGFEDPFAGANAPPAPARPSAGTPPEPAPSPRTMSTAELLKKKSTSPYKSLQK